MKIAFDCRMVDHPGIGRYISNLLSFMMLQERPQNFLLFGDPIKLVSMRDACNLPYYAPIYSLKEFFADPFDSGQADILHIPHFNAPLRKKLPLVITIHDLMYLRLKESAAWFKRRVARVVFLNAIKKADKIIAVSENTKKDILDLYPKANGKIRVIYEAADPIFKKISDNVVLGAVRKKYNLPDEFILFVGSLKRHKNIERLLLAYSDLKKKGLRHKLVIVGRYRPDESEILGKIRLTDALYLNEVSTHDLLCIYNLASVLTFPSLYEGFGLPVLEAMSCGLPVVASSATSLPEVAGDAGVLCNPQDHKDISEKIFTVLNDQHLRNALIEKGLKRVTHFSWGKTAKETLDLYKEAVS
jgi:glycosyltransferase involved in cell wall biosynthesis